MTVIVHFKINKTWSDVLERYVTCNYMLKRSEFILFINPYSLLVYGMWSLMKISRAKHHQQQTIISNVARLNIQAGCWNLVEAGMSTQLYRLLIPIHKRLGTIISHDFIRLYICIWDVFYVWFRFFYLENIYRFKIELKCFFCCPISIGKKI